MNMTKFLAPSVVLGLCLAFSAPAFATGLAECDSGPQEDWVSKEELEAKLVEEGWEVRKIKEDGGCWEVYAIDGPVGSDYPIGADTSGSKVGMWLIGGRQRKLCHRGAHENP